MRTVAVTGVLLWQVAQKRELSPALLVTAGVIQLMDAGLGVWQRNLPMAVLPGVMGVVHLGSARLLDAPVVNDSSV